MNAQDFKEGVAKLRRDMEQKEQEEDGDILRRSEMRLELIFNAIKDAARKGERHIVLGERFGQLDWYVVQTLYQSGCRSEPVYKESEETGTLVSYGYRIVWNPTK